MKPLRYSIYILLCVNALLLGSCGIKPSGVEPPETVKEDTFPGTYPDTSTDPKPPTY